MKKHRAIGLSGILAFAALVSACYSPDFESGVHLDKTELVLWYMPNHVQDHILTATLRSGKVDIERVTVRWTTSCNGEVVGFHGVTTDVDDDGFHVAYTQVVDGRSSVRVVAVGPGRAFIIAGVTLLNDTVIEGWCRVIVEETDDIELGRLRE